MVEPTAVCKAVSSALQHSLFTAWKDQMYADETAKLASGDYRFDIDHGQAIFARPQGFCVNRKDDREQRMARNEQSIKQMAEFCVIKHDGNFIITDRLKNKPEHAAEVKAPCVAVATTAIKLFGEQRINGVAIRSGDRVLVVNQAKERENGLWDASLRKWTRSQDLDNGDKVHGEILVIVSTKAAPIYYGLVSIDPIIGKDALIFRNADRQKRH